jgi:hypothetical protein
VSTHLSIFSSSQSFESALESAESIFEERSCYLGRSTLQSPCQHRGSCFQCTESVFGLSISAPWSIKSLRSLFGLDGLRSGCVFSSLDGVVFFSRIDSDFFGSGSSNSEDRSLTASLKVP